MVLEQVLAQLRAELRRVQEAIVGLERLESNLQRSGSKRGRSGSGRAQTSDSAERGRGSKTASENE